MLLRMRPIVRLYYEVKVVLVVGSWVDIRYQLKYDDYVYVLSMLLDLDDGRTPS